MPEDRQFPEYLRDDPRLPGEERSRRAERRSQLLSMSTEEMKAMLDVEGSRRSFMNATKWLMKNLDLFRPGGVPDPQDMQVISELATVIAQNPGMVAKEVGEGILVDYLRDPTSLLADIEMGPGAILAKAGMILGRVNRVGQSVRRGRALKAVGKVPDRATFLDNVKITPEGSESAFGAIGYKSADKAKVEEFDVGERAFTIRRGLNKEGAADAPFYNVYDRDKLIASYDGDLLAVEEQYRGFGLGEELMFDLRSRFPDLPVTSRTPTAQRLAERVFARLERGELPQGLKAKVGKVDADVVDSHNQFGGSTFDPRTGKNMGDSGKYAVSPHKNRELVLDHSPTEAEIAEFRLVNEDLLSHDNAYVGTWYDKDTDSHFIDVAELYDDEKDAARIAQAYRQKEYALLDGDEFPATKVPAIGELERARLRRNLDNEIPEFRRRREESFVDALLPDEAERFGKMNKRARAAALDAYSLMPLPQDGAALAMLGAAQRGWYEASGEILHSLFGDDTPRFTALLASTSPQVPVERNLLIAMDTWTDWKAAGKPTDPEAIKALIRRGGPTSITAPGAVAALTATDADLMSPAFIAALGPKTGPFWANLMGEAQRVTIDAHMVRLAPTLNPPSETGRLGMAASTRAVADEIERTTGLVLDPAEIQEMQWSVLKPMVEQARTSRAANIESMLFADPRNPLPEQGALPGLEGLSPMGQLQKRIEDVPSFASILQDPVEALGGTATSKDLERALRRAGIAAEDIPDILPKGLEEFSPEQLQKAYQDLGGEEGIRTIAQRVDAAKRTELARRAFKKETGSLKGFPEELNEFLFQLAPLVAAGGVGAAGTLGARAVQQRPPSLFDLFGAEQDQQ